MFASAKKIMIKVNLTVPGPLLYCFVTAATTPCVHIDDVIIWKRMNTEASSSKCPSWTRQPVWCRMCRVLDEDHPDTLRSAYRLAVTLRELGSMSRLVSSARTPWAVFGGNGAICAFD